MTSKEFTKQIESGKDIKGMFFVPINYICAGFVPGTYTLKIWGYYPYKIESFGIKPAGKIFFHATIINKLGTVYEHNDFLTSQKPVKYDFNKDLEFFDTEEEAIHECHLRNRGKKGPGPCHNYDMTKVKKSEAKYIEQTFY